jgi:carboxymethylenebutenolidase
VAYYPNIIVAGHWRPDGAPLSRAAVAARLSCPLQVHFGEADMAVPSAEQRLLETALKDARQPVEFHRYPGANHAFHDDTHPSYHREASLASWPRALAFLAHHLGKTDARGVSAAE